METQRTVRRGAVRFRASPADPALPPAARRCRARFLRFFPRGFADETYLEWERTYKWNAHDRWCAALRRSTFRSLLDAGEFEAVARLAIGIEARTNLLFSFEKMALRDAVRVREGARAFALGLWAFLYDDDATDRERFERWSESVAGLPRRRTRVLTWPMTTVWGFIAQPEKHIFLKPRVTQRAAREYGGDFAYRPRPNWDTYVSLLELAEQVREDQSDLCPRDMIDLQSFLWVQGSDEYRS